MSLYLTTITIGEIGYDIRALTDGKRRRPLLTEGLCQLKQDQLKIEVLKDTYVIDYHSNGVFDFVKIESNSA